MCKEIAASQQPHLSHPAQLLRSIHEEIVKIPHNECNFSILTDDPNQCHGVPQLDVWVTEWTGLKFLSPKEDL